MANLKEYLDYDGLGLAELVLKRQVKPSELVEAAISRIEATNGGLNAVIRPMYEEAREAARAQEKKGAAPRGPFSGVPMLLKDLLATYAGVPLTMGCRAYKDYVPDQDSELVKRYKASGAIIMGKTNTPELGLMGITEPELHGATRNPWDPEHTPGGSSGGTASAVASGMVPIGHGGDGGGSIRIPSSFCGLFGLKPTRMRNPTGPYHGRTWQGLAVEHVLTRSVRDSAAMLDVTGGPDVGAPFVTPQPEEPFLQAMRQSPKGLKIAINTESPLGSAVDGECVAAVERTGRLLEELGHKVEQARPEIDGIALAKSYFTLYFGEVAADIAQSRKDTGRGPRRRDFETTTWFFGELGRRTSAQEFVEAIRLWDATARIMGRFHQTWDLYVTPTAAAPPARVGALQPKAIEKVLMGAINRLRGGRAAKAVGIVESIALDILAKTPFTQLANMTGQPAMSVPLGMHESGLPLGVQFVAPFGMEARLLQVARQLEEAQPWAQTYPFANEG